MLLKKNILILLCLTLNLSLAQDYTYYNYSVSEGLPSAESYEIFQDSKGFLWFATDNGVSKFDGKDIVNYNVKDGLSDPVVFSFIEDYKGRIWFRTFSGKLSYYEDGSIHEYRFNKELKKAINNAIFIFSIYCDTQDRLWVATQTIISIDSTGISEVHYYPNRTIQHFSIENHDLIGCTGPRNEIHQFNSNNKSFPISLSNTINNSAVLKMAKWNQSLYVAISNDIFEFDGNIVRKVFTSPHTIISITVDHYNNLWVGFLSHGVNQYKDANFTNPSSLAFLSDKSVTKTLQDHEGSYWFSTLENGIYYLPNMGIKNYAIPISAKITKILTYKKNLLLSDLSGDITALDPVTNKIQWKKSLGLPILNLFLDKHSNLWISTAKGVFITKAPFDKIVSIDSICVIDFDEDKNGLIWAVGSTSISAFTKEGHMLLRKESHNFHRYLNVKDSLLYVPTRLELEVFDLAIKNITIPDKLSKFKILKLLPLNDSLIFAPTVGSGFLIIKHKEFTFKEYNTTNKKSIADNIYAYCRIDSSLWLSTEKGIIKLSIDSSLAENPTYNIVTKKSGLINNKITFLINLNNSIYGFSDKKFTMITLDKINFSYTNPKFYLKKITANNSALDTSSRESLKYDKNTIAIDFGFIAFNNQNISIRHKLHSTSNWIYTTDRNLLLSSMAPDSYKFQLEYSVDNNHWIPGLTFRFQINPPWWETWYFYTVIMALLLLTAYIFTTRRLAQYREKNYYLNVINEHQQKLIQSEIETTERERSRIAKELHDGVGTNLTAIKMYVGQLLKKHNEPVAREVEEQLQLTIKEIKDIIYGLTPTGLGRYGLFEGLNDYIERLNNTIKTRIELNVFGPDLTKPDLKLIIFRIIQELLSNSIKHASATHITIHMNAFPDILNIIYEDDGIGFSSDTIKPGLGLNNIESRIQSINGKLTFESGAFGVSYTIDIPILKTQ